MTNTNNTRPSDAFLCVIDIGRISAAFRLVNYANYFMLLLGAWGAVGMVEQLFTTQTAADLVFTLIGLGAYGFSAWVGWKNIGVLGAVIHGYTRPAMVILATFSALVSIVAWHSVNLSDEVNRDTISGLVISAMLALAAMGGLLALTALGRTRISKLDMRLRDLLRQSLGAHERAKAHHLPPANPRKGTLFGLLGVGWLLGFQLIPSSLLPDNMQQQLWRLAQIGYYFLIYARHFFQPSFEVVMANDKRPPVVFLRSFADDEKVRYDKADSALFDFSLESRLAAHFTSVGPFIAVGAPGDKVPHLGAARASLSDDQWQGTVVDWMGRASLIVVMVGTTHWIAWELKKIVDLSLAEKLIVVFPQTKTPIWKRDVSSQRLEVVRQAFSGTPWEAGLVGVRDEVRPKRARSIIFRPNGRVLCVTSRPRNRESYHLAALISQYVQMLDREEITTAALETKPRNWLRTAAWATALIGVLGLGIHQLYQEATSFDPLPASIPATTTGALRAGNFHFVEQQGGPARASTFKPGDKVQISLDIEGFETGVDGYPDVEIEATLLDAAGARASDPSITKFHQPIGAEHRINFWFSWTLTSSAPSGDYRVEIKLHDVVANTDLTLQPQFHLEESSSK
jgi:hypothetical protein